VFNVSVGPHLAHLCDSAKAESSATCIPISHPLPPPHRFHVIRNLKVGHPNGTSLHCAGRDFTPGEPFSAVQAAKESI
jgi:hypothetical protein